MNAENKLPRFVRPMLARRSEPFDSQRHLFELKWDGMRALAFVGHEDCRLMSRWGNELTCRFPELVQFSGLRPGTVLDGELVVCKDAQPHLGSMQSRLHVSGALKIAHLARALPVTYVVFELLYDDFMDRRIAFSGIGRTAQGRSRVLDLQQLIRLSVPLPKLARKEM